MAFHFANFFNANTNVHCKYKYVFEASQSVIYWWWRRLPGRDDAADRWQGDIRQVEASLPDFNSHLLGMDWENWSTRPTVKWFLDVKQPILSISELKLWSGRILVVVVLVALLLEQDQDLQLLFPHKYSTHPTGFTLLVTPTDIVGKRSLFSKELDGIFLPNICFVLYFAKDCLLISDQKQACSRITQLFGRKWPNTQEYGCWLRLSDHLHRWTPFPDQTKPRNDGSSKSFA